MTGGTPTLALEEIKRRAQRRSEFEREGKTRVVVQVGHCSESVGAASVATTLALALPDTTYLTVAGCDGACFAAPQVVVESPTGSRARFTRVTPTEARLIVDKIASDLAGGDSSPDSFLEGQSRIAMDMCGDVSSTEIGECVLRGGYAGLARALSMSPVEVIEEVKTAGLRGRGGAYFPAALKWEGARGIDKPKRYLVVNSEEGEPGIFKDRHLMEGVPHRIVEGAIIAAYASNVHTAFIYINAEAELSAERMQKAIDEAHKRGLLGDNVLDSGFALDLSVRRGAGGYVCGEETTLLNTMEGHRREPRLRPPFPTESGLDSMPTVINNPETLASLPFIMTEGAAAFAEIGADNATGTKIISLSGSVRRPGVAEVPMGTTVREILYDIGEGPLPGHTLTAIAIGGPSSGLFAPSMLDTPIGPGLLHESGVMLGAGGVIALDERTSAAEAIRHLAAYNTAESCGKCTPCREGTPRMVDALDRLTSGQGSPSDLEELRYLAEVVGLASLCGLGQAAGGPINSGLHFFGGRAGHAGGGGLARARTPPRVG